MKRDRCVPECAAADLCSGVALRDACCVRWDLGSGWLAASTLLIEVLIHQLLACEESLDHPSIRRYQEMILYAL
jgi:hypothetical protein